MAIIQYCKCGAQLNAVAEVCPFCKAVLKRPEPEAKPKPRRRQNVDVWKGVKGLHVSGHRTPGLSRFLTPKAAALVLVLLGGGYYIYGLIPDEVPPEPLKPAVGTAPAKLVLPKTIRSSVRASKWYEGGTLHHKNLVAWSVSGYGDRLATAADVAAMYWMGKLGSMDALKPKARIIEACISAVAKDAMAGQMKVRETAAACAVKLGWR